MEKKVHNEKMAFQLPMFKGGKFVLCILIGQKLFVICTKVMYKIS